MYSSVLSPIRTFSYGMSIGCHSVFALQNAYNQRGDLESRRFAFFDLGPKLSTAKCSGFPLGLVS